MFYKYIEINGKKCLLATMDNHDENNERSIHQSVSDSEDDESDLVIDLSDTVIIPIDGVCIETYNDEIKMICYHYESDIYDYEHDLIKCKGVVEFRISKTNFKEIKDTINYSTGNKPRKSIKSKRDAYKDFSCYYQ